MTTFGNRCAIFPIMPSAVISAKRPDIGQTPDIIWGWGPISPSQSSADRPRGRTMTQLLRCLTLFLLRGGEDFHRAAGFLHRGDRGFRGAVNLNVHLRLDLAA